MCPNGLVKVTHFLHVRIRYPVRAYQTVITEIIVRTIVLIKISAIRIYFNTVFIFPTHRLERNQRNVQRSYNHPSVIIWSLGNETGPGPNFEACYRWIKAEDEARPVQYEQAGHDYYTDIFCPMYLWYSACEDNDTYARH